MSDTIPATTEELYAELARLREENQRLKTQLSGITQYGCVDAAELAGLRDGLDGLIKDYTTMFNAEPHEYLNTIISDLVGLTKHKGGDK